MPLPVPVIDQVMNGSVSLRSVAANVRPRANPLMMVDCSIRAAGDALSLNGSGS